MATGEDLATAVVKLEVEDGDVVFFDLTAMTLEGMREVERWLNKRLLFVGIIPAPQKSVKDCVAVMTREELARLGVGK